MLRTALASLALAVVLLVACRQLSWRGGYAPNPAYRAQVDALLAGRLALTGSPDGLVHDLAWTPTGVHQVWGLGAPLWQLPFELAGRAAGVSPFPDRLALAGWLAVMLFAILRGFRPRDVEPRGSAGLNRASDPTGEAPRPAAEPVGVSTRDRRSPDDPTGEAPGPATEPVGVTTRDRRSPDDPTAESSRPAAEPVGVSSRDRRSPGDARAFQIGAVLLTALLPGLISMLRGRIGIYEEAAIYAYGAAMILLGGLVALRRRPTTARFLLLVGFAGATGLIRPTVWFYGLATLVVASAIVVGARGRAALRVIAIGAAVFAAGGAALYASNALRFGRGSEFGHQLNIHALPGNIVATRFSYPFERAGLGEATVELVGSLFDGPERRSKRGFYQTALHRGQSALPRWREYYFTTFSWPYLPAIAAGLVAAVLAWRRRGDPCARALGAWAAVGGAPLFAFYLHSPAVSSRYQLDLAPAIAAVLVIAWRACAARWPRTGLAGLVLLWLAAVATGKFTRPPVISDPVDRQAAARATYQLTRPAAVARALPSGYDSAELYGAIWTDNLDDDVRCSDAAGARISCDAPPLPGDAIVHAHRLGRAWLVDHYVIPDSPPGGDGATAPGHPWCPAATTVRSDPTAVLVRSAIAPPPLYHNGFGWDPIGLRVPPATLFYVEDPAYIALDVIGPPGTDWTRAVRVAVGLQHLRLVAAADTAGGAQLRFEGSADRPTDRPLGSPLGSPLGTGLQVVFIAFGPDSQLDRTRSELGLRSIRWRD